MLKRVGKDDFKILKVIGRGSYGKVYLVEKLSQNLLVDESSFLSSAGAK